MSFPPFTPAVKWLIIINTAVFVLFAFLNAVVPAIGAYEKFFRLVPDKVVHGWLWQLLTYSFLHAGIGHIFFNMLTLWFIGALLEQDRGTRWFVQLYFVGVIGAALTTIALAYAGFLHLSPTTATVGASGAIYALLVGVAVLMGDLEFWMFPLPFHIKAKYMAAIWILIALLGSLAGGGDIAYVAHLGGIFTGFAFVKLFPRRPPINKKTSERYYGVRNWFYRWKRKRAARKFEVYMRKHNRTVYFDEHGNYIGPSTDDEPDKGNGEHRGPWVN
jgi:membrane associated rhomboid family serine protease